MPLNEDIFPQHNLTTSTNYLLSKLNGAQDKKKQSACRIWTRPSDLPLRLASAAGLAITIDTLIATICYASDEVNNYVSIGTPALINGILGILPLVPPFMPNLFAICFHCDNSPEENISELVALIENERKFDENNASIHIELSQLKEPIKENLTTLVSNQYLAYKTLIADHQEIITENEKAENQGYSFCDNFINVIYLLTRAAVATISLIKICEQNNNPDADTTLVDTITRWVNFISSVAYLAYLAAGYLPARCKRNKENANEDKLNPTLPNQSSIIIYEEGAVKNEESFSSSLFSPQSKMLKESLLQNQMPSSVSSPKRIN